MSKDFESQSVSDAPPDYIDRETKCAVVLPKKGMLTQLIANF